LALFLCILTTTLIVKESVALATDSDRFRTIENIGAELKKRGEDLPSYNRAHPEAPQEKGVSNIASALLYIIEFLKYALGALAVLLIINSSIRVLTEAPEQIEEEKKKLKLSIYYSAIGFVFIMLADQMVTKVFFGKAGEVFQSEESVRQFGEAGKSMFQSIYRVIQALVGTVSVLMFVISGVEYALSAGNENAAQHAPKRMLWGSIGILIVGISELVVFDIVFPEVGSTLPKMERAKSLIASITNFASAFIAVLAILGFIYAGYMYVGGGINEENTNKAKKALTASIVGILLAAAAFAISTTLTSGLVPVK